MNVTYIDKGAIPPEQKEDIATRKQMIVCSIMAKYIPMIWIVHLSLITGSDSSSHDGLLNARYMDMPRVQSLQLLLYIEKLHL